MKLLKIISPVVILGFMLAIPVSTDTIELQFGHVGKPGSLFEASVCIPSGPCGPNSLIA